jgi:hypothetical protein
VGPADLLEAAGRDGQLLAGSTPLSIDMVRRLTGIQLPFGDEGQQVAREPALRACHGLAGIDPLLSFDYSISTPGSDSSWLCLIAPNYSNAAMSASDHRVPMKPAEMNQTNICLKTTACRARSSGLERKSRWNGLAPRPKTSKCPGIAMKTTNTNSHSTLCEITGMELWWSTQAWTDTTPSPDQVPAAAAVFWDASKSSLLSTVASTNLRPSGHLLDRGLPRMAGSGQQLAVDDRHLRYQVACLIPVGRERQLMADSSQSVAAIVRHVACPIPVSRDQQDMAACSQTSVAGQNSLEDPRIPPGRSHTTRNQRIYTRH